MVQLYGWSNLISAIANFSIALFVYIKGRGSKLSRIWTLFACSAVIYSFGGWMAVTAKNYDSAFFWWRFSYAGVILLPVLFMHLVYTFLDIKQRLFVKFIYAITLMIWLTNIFRRDLFIGHVTLLFTDSKWFKPAWWVYPPGPLHIFHTFFLYAGLLTYTFIKLIGAYKKSDPLKQNQIKYFSIATILGFIGGGTSYLPCFGINSYPAWNITVSLYTFIIAYAIVRHQLLDIEVIIKKTLVFAGLLASTFAMLIVPTLVIQEYIFGWTGTKGRMLGLTISGIIIMLALRRIENFLINITDKYLFQKKYDYKELLKTFASEVLTVLDLNKLVRLTVDKLTNIMKLQSCGILLLDEKKNEYDLVASQGIKDRKMVMATDNTLATFLLRTKTYLSVKAHGKEYSMPERIVRDMNKLKLELAIPLITLQGGMIGILTLGDKKSDNEYTQDDIDVLIPLARTLAIALNNAQMFDELGKTQAEAAQKEKMAVIGTLSAGINHEICNPLGIARGQCEAFLLNIQDGLYKDKTTEELLEKAQNIMGKVIHETDRATAITKRLSSFAKPSKGEISNDIHIKDEIDEVIALVGYELKLDRIEIIKQIDENVPPIGGDKKQLQEVFFNLIRNSAQAIKEKGKIAVKAKVQNDKVIVEIEDTGHGIPEEKIDQIFNPFYTTKEPGKGTGLGLFIVRQVVERNKGRISVRSKVEEGTTFILEFPAVVKEKVS